MLPLAGSVLKIERQATTKHALEQFYSRLGVAVNKFVLDSEQDSLFCCGEESVAARTQDGSEAWGSERDENKAVPTTARIYDIHPIHAYYYASKRAGRKEVRALFPKFVKRKTERD